MTKQTTNYLDKIDLLFRRYLAIYPLEAERLTVLTSQLAQSDENLNDRKNMTGHLTASALVMDSQDHCLLIYHRFLARWLQPGGHLDPGEMPETGAMRELKEETGLSHLSGPIDPGQASDHTNSFPIRADLCPIDIDSHSIPSSIAKQEGEHLHHDFQYIFRVKQEGTIILDHGEVSDYKWASLDSLLSGTYGQRLARVAGKIIAARSHSEPLRDSGSFSE